MDSGYSWIFSAPVQVATQGPILFRVHGSVFLAYKVVLSDDGDTYQGYVQWLTKPSAGDLKRKYPCYTWMKTVNDPQVYGFFLTPDARVFGDPRLKLPINIGLNMGTIKKKIKKAISLKFKDELLKASIEVLSKYQ